MSLAETLAGLAAGAAKHATGLQTETVVPRMTIWRHNEPTRPTPAMFEPKMYLLLQGAKRLAIGDRKLDYAAGDYSVSSMGLPFTGQVTEASRAKPYLGVELRLDPAAISDLLFELADAGDHAAPAIAVSQAPMDVVEPLGRLLRLLDTPVDIPIMGALLERELIYRLLRGPMAGTLRQVVQSSTRFAQIKTAVEWIRGNANEPMCVKRLAMSVGMSVTSFHRHFKAVTAHSPLAYQRSIRLLDARQRLALDAAKVTAVAFATGYASSSQFSREYKKMFGVAPKSDTFLVGQ